MNKVLHKIVSLLMAFVVLFSTMSFTLDMHYCGDTLVDTAVFQKAKTCGMEIQKLPANSDCSVTKKDCCSDEQLAVSGQDELKNSFDKLNIDQQIFVASFVYSYFNIFEYQEENTTYTYYTPPLVVRNIYKIDESYLI